MNADNLRNLLERIKDGEVGIDQALEQLKHFPYEDIGFAKLDHHRSLRRGFPEVILCHGKTNEQVVRIAEHFLSKADTILATRANPDVFADVQKVAKNAKYHPLARMIVIGEGFPVVNNNEIMVVTAGTSDIAIAEEAALTAETMGNRVGRLYDVGVAGLHRLMDHTQKMAEANVIIAVAGMEGALPSVVSGLVDCPVIAVPTSVGYGASFEGLAALLGMLNSCSPGIAVVNIDNGFGAGYLAGVINRQSVTKP